MQERTVRAIGHDGASGRAHDALLQLPHRSNFHYFQRFAGAFRAFRRRPTDSPT
jgi:hypothetical protein